MTATIQRINDSFVVRLPADIFENIKIKTCGMPTGRGTEELTRG